METLSDNIIDSNDDWPVRCAYWQSEYQKQIPKRKRREKAKTGLILTGNGLSINVDKERLIIKDGFTHYPQKAARFEFFKGALEIPPRIVIVDGNGFITLDALSWMSEQNVDLIRLTYDGQIQSVISPKGYSADPKLVSWQRETRSDDTARLKFATDIIRTKITESKITLESYLPESAFRDKGIVSAEKALQRIRNDPPESVGELLALEGNTAQTYFYAWRHLDLKWKATKAYPIPENWKRFFSRSALRARGGKPTNKRATHPVNAMLNYAYGFLESRVRIETIAEGYDPSLGIMHDRIESHRHSFVFDRMEPLRPVVDRTVLELINAKTLLGADFQLQSDGVVRVNPDLARLVVFEFTTWPLKEY
jgi:CRISPR-associated protein Cas1